MTISIFGKQTPNKQASNGLSMDLSGDGIVVSTSAAPPIPVNRWIRNGKHPNAAYESLKAQSAMQSVLLRGKELFRSTGCPISGTAGPGVTNRWRFACHTGPYTRAVKVVVAMLAGAANQNSFGQLDLFDGTTTTSETFYLGATNAADSWALSSVERLRVVQKIITVNPDTTYFGTFTDNSWSILQSACVYELASLTEIFGGYLPQNFAVGGPILDAYRQNLATITRAMWRRGGSQLLNWFTEIDTDASILTTTFVNVVDGSSTTNTPSTPGFYLDLTGRTSRSQTSGVPVQVYVYARNKSLVAAAGQVQIRNSANTTLFTFGPWNSDDTGHWFSASGFLPASADKYDILFANPTASGQPFQVNAVSIFEYVS